MRCVLQGTSRNLKLHANSFKKIKIGCMTASPFPECVFLVALDISDHVSKGAHDTDDSFLAYLPKNSQFGS